MNTVATRRMFLFLLILTVASTAGFQGWRSLFNNFAVEVVGIDGQEMGLIQGIREIPGFLALLVIYILLIIREHRLAALSVLVLGGGIAMTGLLPSTAGLIASTLVMSFGFHYYETLNQSLTLQYFDRSTAPLVFGRLRGVGSAVNILMGGVVYLAADHLDYTDMFLILGGVVAAGAAWCLFLDPSERDLPVQHRRMILRRKYRLFYALTFMAGARRQIFVAFAVFLMVTRFEYTVAEIAILFTVNNAVNTVLSPLIGKAIVRFGERAVLSLEYAGLLFVFSGYALTDSGVIVAILYVADHIFFNFAIAIRTYFQKIADPADISPSMAVGFTINHIVAVAVPVIGGALWMVDYRIPFLAGAAMSLVSLTLVQFIRTPEAA